MNSGNKNFTTNYNQTDNCEKCKIILHFQAVTSIIHNFQLAKVGEPLAYSNRLIFNLFLTH